MDTTLILAVLLLVCQCSSGTLQFAFSVAEHVGEHLGAEYLVLISKDSFESDLSGNALAIPTSLISYTVNKDERKMAKKLEELRLAGYLNFIVFLDDGHKGLLKILVNELQLFNSGVSGLCDEADFSGTYLQLRLDTKLYFYSGDESFVSLWETYSVNGITIINKIGAWNESAGLSIPSPNMIDIWHRRTSLHGLTVNVASINRRYLHEIYYEGYPKEYNPKLKYRKKNGVSKLAVIGGGGIFLEPLNILSDYLNFTLNLSASIDDKWGSVNDKGIWNGMIGMVVRGEADIAAASLTREVTQEFLRDIFLSVLYVIIKSFS